MTRQLNLASAFVLSIYLLITGKVTIKVTARLVCMLTSPRMQKVTMVMMGTRSYVQRRCRERWRERKLQKSLVVVDKLFLSAVYYTSSLV